MLDPDELKADLHHYLRRAREALLWKVDGLDEYDVRRPLVPTGTNLLGLVKHLGMVEAAYFGDVFDRPFPDLPDWWADDAEPNVDMWATAQESREELVAFYRRACEHADATIEALPLDAVGRVSWWGPGGSDVTLHQALVHVLAEEARHVGHADLVRELVDGSIGMRPGAGNTPDVDEAWWGSYRDRVEAAAREAAGRS